MTAAGTDLELLDPDVQAIAQRIVARLDQHVAAPQVAAADGGQVDGHPLAGLGPLDRCVMHLHRAHPHLAPLGLDAKQITGGDRPRPERPGRDRPDSLQREHAVDVEARRALGVTLARRDACECREELVEPVAGLGRDRHDLGARDELVRLGQRELQCFGVGQIRLRDGDDARFDAEQAQHGQMLERLRPGSLEGIDHEQEQVDSRGPRDHRADESLVARDVDQRQAAAVRQIEWRVAEVDRDPPRLLLGQAVGVLAGQRAHEPRLAVVDVARGADRQRHASTAAATSSTSASASVRQSSSRRPSRRIPTTGGSFRRRGSPSDSSTAHANDGSSASGSAPPPTRATVSSTSPPSRRREPLGPCAYDRGVLAQHAQHRNLAQSPRGVEIEEQRPLERRQGELVEPECTLQRVAPQPLDQFRSAHDEAGLRAAEQLVAAEADEIGPRGQRLLRGRFCAEVEQRAGAEIVDERQIEAPGERSELPQRGLFGEADDAEVRLMHPQQERGVRTRGAFVVVDARPVRCSHLDEPGAGAGKDVGNPEAVTDLDQLAARNQNLAALRECRQGKQHRGRIVVHDERRLGPRQAAKQCSDVVLPRATIAVGQ